MKTLRLCLLLLLAVLLPVRGALAAAMMCPPAGGSSTPIEAQVSTHDGGHHAGVHPATHQHPGATASPGDTSPGHGDECTLCSAVCAATPLASTAPPLPLLHGAGSSVLSTPDARAASFLCDGQERPPRSI